MFADLKIIQGVFWPNKIQKTALKYVFLVAKFSLISVYFQNDLFIWSFD